MANVDNSPFPVEESDLEAAEISCHPEKRASQSPDVICPGFGACRTLLQDSLADGNKASLGFAGAQPIFNPNLDSLKSSPDVPNTYLKSVKRLRVCPQPRRKKKSTPMVPAIKEGNRPPGWIRMHFGTRPTRYRQSKSLPARR